MSVVLLKIVGRKLTIIISGVLFLIAFLCIGLSSLTRSHIMLLVFRVMSGCAVGIAVPSVRSVKVLSSSWSSLFSLLSIYIAETVSAEQRGSLGCVPALLHAGGILASYR